MSIISLPKIQYTNNTAGPYQSGSQIGHIIKVGIATTLFAGGLFLIGRHFYRQVVANKSEKDTFRDGNAATDAKLIKMSFENDGYWGTDKTQLRRVILAIPSKDHFRRVVDQYNNLYAPDNLMRDMKSELKTTEYEEIVAILSAKPETGEELTKVQLTPLQYDAWCKRLKAAFDITYGIFPGTDEEAIKAVFNEIPTQTAFEQLKVVYWNKYGSDFMKDLNSELEFWEKGDMMKIITSKEK